MVSGENHNYSNQITDSFATVISKTLNNSSDISCDKQMFVFDLALIGFPPVLSFLVTVELW